MSAALRKAADRISETAIDDEIVVMSLDSGEFFSLTGTSRAIWEQIDGLRDRTALIEALASQYDLSAEQLAGDVDAFIASLVQARLLEQG